VPEVERPRLVGAVDDLDLRVATLVRVRDGALEARELHAGLEPEVLAEVEGVGPARQPVARVEVARIPAAHGRELVAEGLGEEALLHAAVVAAADELLLQLLVHALRARLGRGKAEREPYDSGDDREAHAHPPTGYQRSLHGVNHARPLDP
jgi:hypothetical protein